MNCPVVSDLTTVFIYAFTIFKLVFIFLLLFLLLLLRLLLLLLRRHYSPTRTFFYLMDFSQSALFFDICFKFVILHTHRHAHTHTHTHTQTHIFYAHVIMHSNKSLYNKIN